MKSSTTPTVLGALALVLLGTTTANASDFELSIHHARHVMRGYPAWVQLNASVVSGSNDSQLDLEADPPSGMSVDFPDFDYRCCDGDSAWRLPFTVSVRIDVGESVEPGEYTVPVTVTERGTGQERTIDIPLVVETVPEPAYPSVDLSPPIPRLERWESEMTDHGDEHCASGAIEECGTWTGCVWYYDGQRAYYQIADYTGDSSYEECAQRVESVYRDDKVMPGDGGIPGYQVFTAGLREDYERTGDETSLDAVDALARNAAYADVAPSRIIDTSRSREVAYSLLAKLDALELGVGGEIAARAEEFADIALSHVDQWFVDQNYRDRIAPFMLGLTAEALIRWHQRTDDPRVIPALVTALDWLWENAWVSGDQAFWYEWVRGESPGSSGAPDLNHLIAPAFAYVYRHTGEERFRDRGDQVFAGGVDGAYLGGGKQYTQSYRWSFDYVRWRTEPVETPEMPDGGVPSSDGGTAMPGEDGGASHGTDAGSEGGEGGEGGDAGVGGDAGGGSRPSGSEVDGSGGCHVAPAGRAAGGWAALVGLALAWLVRRRREG